MKIKQLVFATISLFVLVSCNTQPEPKDYTLKGGVFGTTYKITYLQADKNYQKSIDSLFELINNSVSTYLATSDISRINNGETSIEVDTIFREVFHKSKKIYKETDGYFDPTVGNLVNAYGFGPINEEKDLTEEEIAAEMQFVGFEKVQLIDGKIRKEDPKIYLDFNSIAKGLGIDIIARFLESKDIESYLVEIGGEIRAKGLKENNEPWLIKLVHPIDVENGYKKINLSNKSMATSGNYRKFRVTDDGKKYVHTINPKTGEAIESNLLSASVIVKTDCADADGYATAFMAMGLEKTKTFLEQHPKIEVILIYLDKNQELKEFTTYTE